MQLNSITGQLLTDLIENDGKVTTGWSEVCYAIIVNEYDQEIPQSQSASLQSITNIPAMSKKNWHSFLQQGNLTTLKVFVCNKSFHMSHG